MTNRFRIVLTAGLLALGLGPTSFVLAHQSGQPAGAQGPRREPGPRMRMPGGPMDGGPMGFGLPLHELDLTEDQRTQIRGIIDSHQVELRQAGEKMGVARQAMRTLLDAETLDESAIRAKSGEVAAAEADLAILHARIRAESLQVLTAEQQAKLKELKAAGPIRRRPA